MAAIRPKLLAQGFHGNAVADDAQFGVAGFLQAVELQFQAALLHCVVEHDGDFVDGQGLFEKIEGAEFGGFDGGLNGAVAGDDDHFGAVSEGDFLNAGQGFETVHAVEPDIQQHDFVAVAGEFFDGISRRSRRRYKNNLHLRERPPGTL